MGKGKHKCPKYCSECRELANKLAAEEEEKNNQLNNTRPHYSSQSPVGKTPDIKTCTKCIRNMEILGVNPKKINHKIILPALLIGQIINDFCDEKVMGEYVNRIISKYIKKRPTSCC